jgi:hypothetical protein
MSQQSCFSSQPAGRQAQVLMLDGDFDGSNAAQFEQQLEEALHAGSRQVIVDLRGVSFWTRPCSVRSFAASATPSPKAIRSR